jgi:hypothetical protein
MTEYRSVAAVLPVTEKTRLVVYCSNWRMADYMAWLRNCEEMRKEVLVQAHVCAALSMRYIEFDTDAEAVIFKLRWSHLVRIEDYQKCIERYDNLRS